MLRSLAFALLEHEGDNPAKRDAAADRPRPRRTRKRLAKLPDGWQEGKLDAGATDDLLAALRDRLATRTSCDKVVELLNKGVAPASIWDGLFLRRGRTADAAAGHRRPARVTSANALHYAYEHSGDDETRRLLLLQAPRSCRCSAAP